jgi:hypothetical protein
VLADNYSSLGDNDFMRFFPLDSMPPSAPGRVIQCTPPLPGFSPNPLIIKRLEEELTKHVLKPKDLRALAVFVFHRNKGLTPPRGKYANAIVQKPDQRR